MGASEHVAVAGRLRVLTDLRSLYHSDSAYK